jgi:PAS domain S-box-containing protein
MIWNSIPIMTAIDLLIIAVAIFGIWRFRLFIRRKRPSASGISSWLIPLGLVIFCLFYFADLVSMYAVPASMSGDIMGSLHRNLAWLVVLSGVVTISFGFVRLLTQLQEGEARVRRLVDSNIIGIFIWSSDGWIIDANEAFLRIVGYDARDLVSRHVRWTVLSAPEFRNTEERALKQLAATGTCEPFETQYLHKDGSRVPVLVGAASLERRSGEAVAFVLSLAERKRAEENLREAQMELEQANRITTMGLLTASIAHEIMQPVGAAVANANAGLRWLEREPPQVEKARNSLVRIIKDGNRASEVIDRVRALVKKAPPQKDRVDINTLILDIVALVSSDTRKGGVSVRTQLSPDLPLVWADRIQIQQVILNLMMNAIEAMSSTEEDSRELQIVTGQVSSGVLVEVRDSGSGLDPQSLERIFDPFHTTKSGGMGIGLSICRLIIEAHNGRVWATGNVPRGAIFHLTLAAYSETDHNQLPNTPIRPAAGM